MVNNVANQASKAAYQGADGLLRSKVAAEGGRKAIEVALNVVKMVFGPSISLLIFWDFYIIATVFRL